MDDFLYYRWGVSFLLVYMELDLDSQPAAVALTCTWLPGQLLQTGLIRRILVILCWLESVRTRSNCGACLWLCLKQVLAKKANTRFPPQTPSDLTMVEKAGFLFVYEKWFHVDLRMDFPPSMFTVDSKICPYTYFWLWSLRWPLATEVLCKSFGVSFPTKDALPLRQVVPYHAEAHLSVLPGPLLPSAHIASCITVPEQRHLVIHDSREVTGLW